jgi:hypothetical protein
VLAPDARLRAAVTATERVQRIPDLTNLGEPAEPARIASRARRLGPAPSVTSNAVKAERTATSRICSASS